MSDEQQTTAMDGRLAIRDHGEASDVLFLGEDSDPLAEQFGDALGAQRRQVSVRYFISNDPLTPEQRIDSLVQVAVGEGFGEYLSHYTDITGYLWTDETMVVGGHNLLAELSAHVGMWCRLEITIHA